MIQANFTNADLTGTSLKDANVESAVFRNVQGIDAAQKDQLEAQAQRWKFELKTGAANFLACAYFPAYAFVVLALFGLSFSVLRLQDRSRAVVVAAIINALTLVPALALFCMSLLGASSTVQFNAGSTAAMALWSAWVGLWPLFMLDLLACLVVAVVTALTFLVSHLRWSELKRSKLSLVYVTLTVIHCLFAFHWIGGNFPSA